MNRFNTPYQNDARAHVQNIRRSLTGLAKASPDGYYHLSGAMGMATARGTFVKYQGLAVSKVLGRTIGNGGTVQERRVIMQTIKDFKARGC